jgi:diadenosine tetraphosphatase ApaH/serine/threonine PP2A family protein phosphatase
VDRVAIFSDINGNLAALRAVWADMDARGLENRYCLGDLVGYGTFPNEVIQFIRDHNVPTLMGNYDQGIGAASDDCGCAYTTESARALGKLSVTWTNAHVTAENRVFLRELASGIRLDLGRFRISLVHGSPRRINEYLFENRPDRSLERLLDMADGDVLVCGHTHVSYHRVLPSGRQVANDGSVGKPKDLDSRACYAILGVTGGNLVVEFPRVTYDIEQTALAIEASSMPNEYADMLRNGTG